MKSLEKNANIRPDGPDKQRKAFVKPSLERKEKLPKVTNTYVGTFNP